MAARRRLPDLVAILVSALLLGGSAGSVLAQTAGKTPADVPLAPGTTPPHPADMQPKLPSATPAPPTKPSSPVVEEMVRDRRAPLDVRKAADRPRRVAHRRVRRAHRDAVPSIERPALAGVQLTAPLPPPVEPPHIVVPTPAYPVEAFLVGFTTPPPPIVCHHTRRHPYAPDPRLYREVPVECEPDNP